MSENVKRVGMFTISPCFSPVELLKGVDVCCDDVLCSLRPRPGDEYQIFVDLVKAKRYEPFTSAHNRMLVHPDYRLLNLDELLFVNLRTCSPLLKYCGEPIIGRDFVLDFEPEETGHNTEVYRHKWLLRSVFGYHGFILGSKAKFAVTPRTDVDRGVFSEGFLERHNGALEGLQQLKV